MEIYVFEAAIRLKSTHLINVENHIFFLVFNIYQMR